MKKVGYLLRVSTKKQVNKEDDIPMQRNACLEFIAKHEDWEVYDEYLEPGVSGYHMALKDRKELQRAIQDASDGKFDILVVFMFDRLGRKNSETPLILEYLNSLGIEVWSVNEGQQKFENDTDELINILRFWGASNESKKTARRVDGGRTYATRKGKFTGGVVPFGYMLQPSGNLDKKGRMINVLTKDPTESNIVKKIYDLLIEENMTLNGIIGYLNEELRVKTRKGNKWNTSSVRNILKNPIYKGYVSYGKTRTVKVWGNNDKGGIKEQTRRQRGVSSEEWVLSEECNEEWLIVSEERWQLAQDILARRYKKYQNNLRPETDRTWKSSLLLVGLLECGYCHGAISPAVSSQKSISKDGSVEKCRTNYYRCNTRARDKRMCEAKTYISKYKLEKVVLAEVYGFLDRLEKIDCTEEIRKKVMGNSSSDKDRLSALEKRLSKTQRAIQNLKEEIYKSYLGDVELDKKYINEVLAKAEQDEKELQSEIGELKLTIKSKEIAVEEYETTVKMIPVWRDVFENAPINIKKHLLSMLIEKIVVKGCEVDIFFKINIDSFINIQSRDWLRDNNVKTISTVNGHRESYKKIIEDSVNVSGCNF